MEKVNEILVQKSVRITPMRQLLLEYFLMHKKTLGLVELEIAFPKSDRITMYRTLKTFEEKGIVHRIENGKLEMKYALCQEHCTPANHLDQHPHFYCRECGQTTCLESILIPSMQLPEGYTLEGMNMTIKGVCQNC